MFISFSFSATGIASTSDVPTRINIKKRREHIVYRTLSNQDKININAMDEDKFRFVTYPKFMKYEDVKIWMDNTDLMK